MLARYAGKGFALDCLSQKMLVPYIEKYTYFNVKSGNVVCDPGTSILPGIALAILLVVIHTALLVAPLFMIPILSSLSSKLRVKHLDVIYVALGVFTLGSFGEITQHMHDNWLYLGLIPSFNNAVFYGGLTTGQGLLAWGIGGFGIHVIINVAASLSALFSIILATFLTADAANPTFFGIPIPIACYVVAFLCLTITTGDYLWQSFKQFKGFKLNVRFAVGVVVSYAAGITFATLITTTGHQYWHIFTALGFTAGFTVQMLWLIASIVADTE